MVGRSIAVREFVEILGFVAVVLGLVGLAVATWLIDPDLGRVVASLEVVFVGVALVVAANMERS